MKTKSKLKTPAKGKVKSAKPTKRPAAKTAKNAQKSAAQKPSAENAELYLKNGSEYIPVRIKTHRDSKGGHYHIVLETFDGKHVSIGLSTKSTKGKGSKNYRLGKSPLDDGKTSYMRRQGTVASTGEYTKPRKGTMTPKDYGQAKIYGKRAKQKHLNNKVKKKVTTKC